MLSTPTPTPTVRVRARATRSKRRRIVKLDLASAYTLVTRDREQTGRREKKTIPFVLEEDVIRKLDRAIYERMRVYARNGLDPTASIAKDGDVVVAIRLPLGIPATPTSLHQFATLQALATDVMDDSYDYYVVPAPIRDQTLPEFMVLIVNINPKQD